ncbi:MAG: hypothetical protein IJL89_03455 [Firmicutes bacterium]|nr:hypothetical protein [Bacillota bacterium]
MNSFVFDENGLSCFYRGGDGSIYKRAYIDGRWSRAVCVISDVRRHYSVSAEKPLSLVCQETGGNIMLCREKSGEWHNRILLEGRGLDPPDMLMMRFENCLIFNLPRENEHTLIIRRQRGGKWERSELIDSFVPFRNCLFRLIRLENGRGLLIYRKNMYKQCLGYRVLEKNGDFGEFHTVFAASGVISDISAAMHRGILHFAAAERTSFSNRLIYTRASEQASEQRSQVLWEGMSIENTAIRADEHGLTVTHNSGRRIYTFKNGGTMFKPADIKQSGTRLAKAYVLGGRINDIIVPADKPYDVEVGLL